MFTGPLVHHRGSLARAALPYVVPLRWGWHRGERAMERGKVSRDPLFDRAFTWCGEGLPGEPVGLGPERRTGHAIDSSPVVRLRAHPKRGALLGKGYCPRARRAVPAHLVAALTTVVRIRGVRVGVVGRTRLGARCQEAVAAGSSPSFPVNVRQQTWHSVGFGVQSWAMVTAPRGRRAEAVAVSYESGVVQPHYSPSCPSAH